MRRFAILATAVVAAGFHLYAAGVSPFTALVQRPVHLALMTVLALLMARRRPGSHRREREGRDSEPVTLENEGGRSGRRHRVGRICADALLGVAAVSSFLYLSTQHESLVRRVGAVTPLDLAAGAVAIVVVLELARRTCGMGLVAVAVAALAYALAGPYLSGFLAHRGYSPRRLIEHLYLSTEGIWGIPLGVSADFVYLFVLFGAILDAAGGGTLLIGLAERIAGRAHGGPAKTASVASALMGSLSGSAVANVVTTGTLTIPLMRRAGFAPHFAAAVEAAASTGGQLMPPVMGAGAFILATWTNIPYVQVAVAAAGPALLYYAALYTAIHFRAGRRGMSGGMTTIATPGGRAVAERVHLLAPLLAIIVLLASGRSPMRAAFWGVVVAAAAAGLRQATRLDRQRLFGALTSAAGGTVQVAAACATAGIVVGVASLTGIGLRMSELIVTLSDGRLPVALVLTAAGSIVLGMGLPTTAAYVVLAALGAPALTQLGVPLLAAHLFIFYFGCISNVTPPVALAAYAAAGVAGAAPLRTAVTAMALSSTGFLVPFLFVYGQPLLLDGSGLEVGAALLTGLAGVTAWSAAIIGFARRRLRWWERIVAAAAAIAMIIPDILTDAVGLGVIALVLLRKPGSRGSRG